MEDEIKHLEQKRLEAMAAGNVDMLASMLSEKLLYLHSTGDRDDKATYLGQLRDGVITYNRITPHEAEVHVAGDTALLFGHIDADVTRDGNDRTLDYDYLAVWARTGGRWQLFAYQPRP